MWRWRPQLPAFPVIFSFDLRSRNGIFKAKSIFTLRIFRGLSLFPFPSLILFVWGSIIESSFIETMAKNLWLG